MVKIIKFFVNLLGIRKLLGRLRLEIIIKQDQDFPVYDDYPSESLNNKRFYNIGAGSFRHPNWTNVDFQTEHYKKVQTSGMINYNLMELAPLPIESGLAEIVYSSHTIEHVSDEAVQNILKESYRILKPGGCIRLTTPDAALVFKNYQRGDLNFWYWRDYYSQAGIWEQKYTTPLSKASIHQLFLLLVAAQLCKIEISDSPTKKYTDSEIMEVFSNQSMEEGLDFFTRQCVFNPECPGNHVNWWTYEKIFTFLEKAGFSEMYKSGYGQSLFAPLRNTSLFDNTHPKISLYVEAIK